MVKAGLLGSWKSGEGKYEVELTVYGTGGEGLSCFLYGGELAHVGGVAAASPRQRSDGNGMTADVSTICLPGHKDVYAAQVIAKKLCVAAGENVSVTAGIHIDSGTDDDIRRLQQECMNAADAFLTDYTERVE